MPSMLTQEHHARLMQDMPNVCAVAGVQQKFLHESMKLHCTPVEVDWVIHYHENVAQGVPGLLIEGGDNTANRFQAIAAALLRNYIDARVIGLNTVLDLHEKGEMVSPSVLLIPNLYIASYGKTVPAFKVQAMYDLLFSRAVNAKPTVVYVEDLKSLHQAYGAPFYDFLSSFRKI